MGSKIIAQGLELRLHSRFPPGLVGILLVAAEKSQQTNIRICFLHSFVRTHAQALDHTQAPAVRVQHCYIGALEMAAKNNKCWPQEPKPSCNPMQHISHIIKEIIATSSTQCSN